MRFFRITRASLPRWQPQLEALERLAVYPLGRDAFRISHGRNYFAFFERMGRVAYYAMAEGGTLAAVGCGILRDDSPRRWYVSDVKVHPRFRGRHLMVSMIYRAFWQNYLRCPRGYAVAMDPPDGRTPPALRSFSHFRWLPASTLGFFRLDLYSADDAGARRALPLIARGLGTPRFLSLLGVKDLILESTRAPLPLLHLSFSSRPAPREFAEPQPGHTHMWCVPREDPRTAILRAAGFVPTATATVIYHRLGDFDGTAIETAEI